MAIFLEDIYRLKAIEANRTPLMVIIDEADAIAPQKPQDGEQRMLGAAEDLVRRGGQRGLGCILITQRSAVLNKNVLTQAEMLIVLRTIAPHDLKAIKEWIDVHGTIEEGKTLIESLPSLPIGDAWFWSPGWPTEDGIFTRSRAYPITTFDSAATPKPGAKKIVPKNLADVDLNSLKKQMAETIEKAKSDDPKILKKKIAELEKELIHRKSVDQSPSPQNIEKILNEAVKIALQKNNKIWSEYSSKFSNILNTAWQEFLQTEKQIPTLSFKDTTYIPSAEEKKIFEKIKTDISEIPKPAAKNRMISRYVGEKVPFGRCARAIYSYLRIENDPGTEKTKTQVAVAVGYSQNSGGFNNAISELSSSDLIVRRNGMLCAINSIPFRDDLAISVDVSLEKWSSKLGACSRKIWEELLNGNRTDSWLKENVAANTNYSVSSGGFNNSISELSSLGLIERLPGGMIRINPEILNL